MFGLIAFLCALAVSYAGTRLLLRRPPTRGFVDVPNERSSHARPKPRIGGVAIVGAFFAAIAVTAPFTPVLRPAAPFVIGAAILFVTGLADDWRRVSVALRLVAQTAAAAAAIGGGLVLRHAVLPVVGEISLGPLAVPFTAVFIVASINFYNFIDGIDGLAAGSAFIASVFLALAAVAVGQPVFALVYLAVAGSALGFLQFNFPPSKLFMGDSGSTFFGYFFATMAIAGNAATPSIPVFVPLLILSSLYLDAGLTVITRFARRERLFQAHRTHYYQRLLSIGLNHKQVTMLEYLITTMLGASALVYMKAGSFFAPFVCAIWLAVFTLAILKIRSSERGGRMFWERRALFVIAADFAAIVVAYVGAYFLRMNFRFTQAEGNAMLQALPLVVIVRSACFFKYGLYRSVWKYTSTADVVRVIKAVTAGSAIILTAVVLLYRFVAFPRTLFIIEYVLLILLVLGARFSMRLFHEIGREPQGDDSRRYAVIGADDAGERAARELNARGPRRSVVCFVDDDPRRIGLLLHGCPIEGPADSLADICRRHRVDALVYAVDDGDDVAATRWLARAHDAGVPIERAPGAYVREPDAIVSHRTAVALGRTPPAASPRVAASLRGQAVLVTNGGGVMGNALATGLRAAGAVPVFHVVDPASRLASRLPDDVAFYAGSLFEEASAVVDAVVPDVVIHVVTAEPAGGLNDDDFAWHHLVRESERLARAVWKRPGCRFVIACQWGSVASGDRVAAMAAIMEAIVLNRAGTEAAAVLRLPRVLPTERAAESAAAAETFDLLESEAASLVLEVAAGAFRGIYAPAPGPAFELSALRRNGAPASTPPAGRRPVFPAEHLDECGVAGIRRVLSPLFPAPEPFRKLAVAGPPASAAAGRDEWIRAVAGQLYQIIGADEGAFRA